MVTGLAVSAHWIVTLGTICHRVTALGKVNIVKIS